ncbi:acyl-CoA dehydrogenase family protein [Xanthobacter sp. V4C-4]|uniref:acyl-CoA dehydrogenase family protein n=1 Tax=Xanthobacter cornucopiae TaxID=3119924 RepID=UPI00372AF19D
MDFEFSPRQRQVYEEVGRLGREVFAPRAAGHDAAASLPLDNLKDLGDLGLLKLTISSDLGGEDSGAKGSDPLLYLLAVEQTARHCPSTGQCLHIHSHGAHYVNHVGTPQQRRDILGRVVEEQALLNATGSEPGRTARGLYGLETLAERRPGGYSVTGLKNYATLADVAAYNIVFALLADQRTADGHLGVAIPQGTRGFSVVPGTWDPIGMRGAVSPQIRLDDVFVPDALVLGAPGTNPRERWQAKFHLGFAAQYLGAAQGVFDQLRTYLPARGTTGDAYAQLRFGEIRVAIESARWLVYRAAWLWTRGDDPRAELYAMEAKHRTITTAVEVLDKAAAIAGSSAFLDHSALARFYRDLRFHTLHENVDRTAATIGQAYLGEAFDTTARL